MGYEVLVGPLLFIIYFDADYVVDKTQCVRFTELAKILQELEI